MGPSQKNEFVIEFKASEKKHEELLVENDKLRENLAAFKKDLWKEKQEY